MSHHLARLSSWLFLAAAVAAQTAPSSLTLVTSHTVIPFIPGGIAFDPTGNTLYVGNVSSGNIQAVAVIRDPITAQITGFGAGTLVTAAPNVDAGIEIDAAGTLIWTRWPTHTLGQFTTAAVTGTASLAGSGVPSSTGGIVFVPGSLPTAGDVLVSCYSVGGIYKIDLTPSLSGNGTYDVVPASAVLYASTPAGAEGLAHIPSGPLAGSLIYANWNTSQVVFLGVDATTGAPNGQTGALITGITNPMDVAFDPITNDLFVSTYQSTANLKHYTGTVVGDYQTNQVEASLTVNLKQGSMLAPAVTTALLNQPINVAWDSTLVGNPSDIFLSFVPPVPAQLTTGAGQIINISLAFPLLPAFNFFGLPAGPFSFPMTLPVGTVSAQYVVLDGGSPDGFRLSQPCQVDVINCSALENLDATGFGTGVYPPGFSNGGGSNQWINWSGPTSSVDTGPDVDHTQGNSVGRYMYCETSISGTGTFIMKTPNYAVVGGENAKFWYHMFGLTTGTLKLEQETSPGVWTTLWSLAGDQGNTWHQATAALIVTGSGTAQLRLHYTWGGSFTGDAAIDDFGVCF
jgi:hypothetical protein